jgi:hypothetical protein
MSAKQVVDDIFAALRELPMDKLVEVRDFAVFLKGRCGETSAPMSDYDWTKEELRDLSEAVWDHGNRSVSWADSTTGVALMIDPGIMRFHNDGKAV